MESIPTNLCELFTQSVQKFPENLAVDHEDGRLTYKELDNASSALAHDLILLGVDNGSSVLLMTAHGSFNVIAILAILKAGACVVPIDRKSWSSEMIHYVCTTVSSQVIVNTTREPFMATSGSHHVLHLTSLPSTLPSNDYYMSLNKASIPDACIIFTSGSTGRPKGVILSHKSLCLYSKTSPLNLDINPGDRLLHILSVAFDASACTLFSALGNGGTVVPTLAEDLYVKAPSCTVMAVTPSMLSNLPKVGSHNTIFSTIHTIILGGETASSDLLESWVDAGVRVLIGYGATETTSMGSIHEVIRDPESKNINASLIGRSTEQSPIWLVNSDHQLIEDELLEGEIFISGDGVSRGYYQEDINTNNNFAYWNSLRVYKTGDYGRWVRGPAGDWVLEFRGRKDRTIKNGGFLVNLDRDVEDALHRAGTSLGVTSVCAAAAEDGIIAVVTPESVDKTALLEKARQSMCSYCFPYRIEAVKSIPMSSNGKVQLKKVLEIISFTVSGDDFDSHTTTPSFPLAQVSDIETIEEKEKLSKILTCFGNTNIEFCLADYDKAVKDAETEVGLGCSLEFLVYSSATASSGATSASIKLNHITELTIIGIGGRIRSLVSLQPQLPGEKSNPPPVRVESLENSDFPLSLLIESTGEFRIVYDCYAFNETTVRRIGGHFKHALRGILHYTLVGECRRINELQEAAYKKSEIVRIRRNEQTMKQVLEASMDRFQDLVALEDCKGSSLTYGQLDEQANLIASKINAHVANHNTTAIAIYGDGSTEWLLGILAIIKTSRAFVPIDPKWPMERKAMVLDASGATAILIPDSIYQNKVPETTVKQIFVVKDLLSHKSGEQKAERLSDCGSADSVLLYIFTSGTTGVPKEATMFAAPGRRIAQFMSPAFDVCNLEIFSALLHGATLVLRDPEDPYAHLSKVNTAMMTPTVLSVLDPDEFPNIEIIYSTGELITSVIVQNFATKKLIYNAYGPAECAVFGLFERMILGDELTIGTTSETVRAYIFDEEQNLLPHGVQGEIYLAGVQVLQQYINAPEQTALRIYPDPWYQEERMYRTGDYGICEKYNRITCIGRIDRQVKIRGFRVELDSVEQSILSEPAINRICQCSVIAIDGALVAFIKFNSDESQPHPSVEDRINQLRDRLEKTMLPSWVPQLFISLSNFPKSINGKVDSKALETMYRSRASLREEPIHRLPMQPTNSSVTSRLAGAWRGILQLQPDVHLESTDNFFRLGGHSVLAMLLATKLTSIFEVKVTPRELLPAPVFQDQVNVIEQLLSAKEANIYHEKSELDAKIVKKGKNALSIEVLTELEKQVWLQYQVAEKVTAFNISNILTISGQVDYSKLIYSFNTALASDPVLSCNFIERPDGLRRTIRDSPPRIHEISELDIAAEINFPFNLEQDELIRLHVIRQPGEREIEQQKSAIQIIIVTSHSIADLATLQNLLRIVSAAYAGQNIVIHKEPQHLSSCRWRYSPSFPEKHFWQSYLEGYDTRRSRSSFFQLPLLPSTMATFQGSSRTREFHGHTIIALNSLIKRLGITHHQMALAVAALLLQWLADEDDIILGAPNANRPTPVEQDALGQFLDRLPIRINLESSSTAKAELKLTQVLADVRDSALQALANAIPFNKILESLSIPSGSLTHPIFDCMVTFHPSNASLDKWLQLPLCQVAASPLFAKGSKFPLMLEWFELDSDRWSLHIEHDTRRLPSHVSNKIEVGLQTILEAMVDECSLSELHSRLNTAIQANQSSVDSQLKAWMSTAMQGRLPSLSVTEVVNIVRSEMASCLGVDDTKILPETSFFSSGADSKAAVTLRHRLRIIGLEVSLRAIFMARSPIELVSHITV
ncbi:hypothetical protein GGI43DRAFT_429213 [Trichoderma evansii]